MVYKIIDYVKVVVSFSAFLRYDTLTKTLNIICHLMLPKEVHEDTASLSNNRTWGDNLQG